MTVVTVYDAIHSNISHLPHGQAAGYVTGSGGIAWTAADWKAHPGAVRIDQDAAASDPTADVLDVEAGAASPADCPGWAKRALADYAAGRRPGQRRAAIYCSRSNVPAVLHALDNGGIKSGVGLWIADWNGDRTGATAEVTAGYTTYPVIGRQYANAGLYDISVFSQKWLQEVSVAASAPPPVPPGQWLNPSAWTWKDAYMTGVGLDGKLHIFHLENGTWVKLR